MFQIEHLSIVLGLADFIVSALMVTIPYWFLVMAYRKGKIGKSKNTLVMILSTLFLLITTFGLFSLHAETGFYNRYRHTYTASMLGALNLTAYIWMLKQIFKHIVGNKRRETPDKGENE